MKENENGEFYIGYQPAIPARLRRTMRRVVIALLGLIIVAGMLIGAGFQRLPASYFEFGHEREFAGTIVRNPYPALIAVKSGDERLNNTLTQYLLVGGGKHAVEVGEFIGRAVKLRGTLIHRQEGAMIEVAPGSIGLVDSSPFAIDAPEDLGLFTLKGEIVDSKCYLGVMNPGRTKVHRDCAVRCISGGVPPLFVARDSEGNEIALLLTSSHGEAVNQDVLEIVAEPVEIAGHVFRQSDSLSLRADPATYKRLNR